MVALLEREKNTFLMGGPLARWWTRRKFDFHRDEGLKNLNWNFRFNRHIKLKMEKMEWVKVCIGRGGGDSLVKVPDLRTVRAVISIYKGYCIRWDLPMKDNN